MKTMKNINDYLLRLIDKTENRQLIHELTNIRSIAIGYIEANMDNEEKVKSLCERIKSLILSEGL